MAIGAALLGGFLWRRYRSPPHDPDRIPDQIWNALSTSKKKKIKELRKACAKEFLSRDDLRAEIQKVIDQ